MADENETVMLSRVKMMTADEGQTWDLSPRDRVALRYVLTTLARLTAEVGSLRGELATVRDELAKCADAVSGYFNDGDSVSDTVQVVADALGHAKAAEHGLTAERDMWRSECESISAELDLPPGIRPAEGELRRMLGHNRALLAERDEARAAVALLTEQRACDFRVMEGAQSLIAELTQERDASDTTRREWEVRAATSYAAGRAAGLREAAEVCHAIKQENGDDPRVWLVDYMEECEQRILALAPPAAETVPHDGDAYDLWGPGTPAAEPRDEGEVSDG